MVKGSYQKLFSRFKDRDAGSNFISVCGAERFEFQLVKIRCLDRETIGSRPSGHVGQNICAAYKHCYKNENVKVKCFIPVLGFNQE